MSKHDVKVLDCCLREHLSQTQNLLSLFRDEGETAIGEPMLAVTDVDYRLGEQEAFASSRAFEPVAQVVDRAKGDNGGPVKGEEAYVFVDAVLDEDLSAGLIASMNNRVSKTTQSAQNRVSRLRAAFKGLG